MNSLTVVGGYYRERCFEPAWNDWYGPGFRAAAAISGRGTAISLHTYCTSQEGSNLEYRCRIYGIAPSLIESAENVEFSYLHWLQRPRIWPEVPNVEVFHEVTGENVLCYGFYEGGSSVNAERCVFDPQTKKSSRDRIVARELVVVCNYAEACSISGIVDGEPQRVAEGVAKATGAAAVLVKGAWTGSWVWTPRHCENIPAIPTAYVHKIGSGDVFSAEFAYAWMIERADILEGARFAARQTAYYCDNASIPNPSSAAVKIVPPKPIKPEGDFDIYIAAPFFDVGQMYLVNEFRRVFRGEGLRVFSPYHEVGWGLPEQVAPADILGLNKSRCVIACLGTVDVGTIFEVGHAQARGIPVVAYAPRMGQNDETMLSGTGCEIVRDFTSAVYRAIWTCLQ